MYDAIIVGSGGAALSAAIELKLQNKNIVVVTKSSVTSSQTVQAQGGINGVMNSNDSIESHIADTKKSAHGLFSDKMVEYMCNEAPNIIKWLDTIGVPFNRDDKEIIDQRKLGGASFNRANYSSDYTGLKILHTLYDKARSIGITFIEDAMLLNLINENDDICGITYLSLQDTEVHQILASNTILATGGYGGVYHNYTTNSIDTTADGIIAAYNAGANLENLEMVQFHPTALKDKFILISESARGEGGYLVTKNGERFVDELLPRDVVAREITKKLKNEQEVFLDLRHLGKEKILHLMPQEYKLAHDYLGLKMDQELIPIIPACHYSMGGIKVDVTLSTSLNNLYAIGEVSSSGVHGANRLGGNSLLEIVTFGKKVCYGLEYDFVPEDKEYKITSEDKKKIDKLLNNDGESLFTIKNNLGQLMYENVGLFRDETLLSNANDKIEKLNEQFKQVGIKDKSKIFNMELKQLLELQNLLICAKLITKSASLRKESRGAHYRLDYQDELSIAQNTIIEKEKGVYFENN
ncbi:MAG TPA: FAD-binding protein [Arcobacter sp.]|nr:FAD-binding protein [Arcobacter sp.]